MELSWPTFTLQIVNFLVLIWILKRFMYQPILQAIAQRRTLIEKQLADAKALQEKGQALEHSCQQRLADWEIEKRKLRAELDEEIAARRAQLMAALNDALKQERDKARVLDERRVAQLRSEAEAAGLAAGVQFTARLLDRAAGPELEAKLIDLALEDLRILPADQIKEIRAACRPGVPVKVSSAYAIDPAQRAAITQNLRSLKLDETSVQFTDDHRLGAGLRVSIGPWVLRANLADELEFFSHGFAQERNP